MEYKKYLPEMKNIQENIIDFINNDDKTEEDFINLEFLKHQKLDNQKFLLKETLLIISSMANHHHHTKHFFNKIFAIIKALKTPIKLNFSNYDIFWIFKSNKRVLLFLLDEKIIKLDNSLTNILSDCKYFTYYYQEYFYSEIGSKRLDKLPYYNIVGENYWPLSVPNFPIIDYTKFYETLYKDHECDIVNGDNYDKNGFFTEPKMSDEKKEFEKKRRNGENDDVFASVIRQDLIEDFASDIKEDNIELDSTINPSVFETNTFLFGKNPTLLQYAMFCGSVKIVEYLCKHNVKLDSSLWLYAVHGKNADILKMLKEKKLKPENDDFLPVYLESIKCHHNSISFYIKNQLLKELSKSEQLKVKKCILKYHNYALFPDGINEDTDLFYEFCKYGYTDIVDNLLQKSKIDVNKVQKMEKKINLDFIRTNTALNAAVSHNNHEIVNILISQPSADVNSQWIQELSVKKDNKHYHTTKTPLLISIEKENVDMVELLLTHPKIDVNCERHLKHHFLSYTFEESKTALSLSIIHQNFEIFQLLLQHKSIDVNKTITFGYDLGENNKTKRIESPLVLAIDFELMDYFQLLLANPKIDVNIYSEYKEYGKRELDHPEFDYCEFTKITALNLLIKRKNIEMVKALLKHPGVKVNLKSNPGMMEETPLLAAFENGSLEVFEMLLANPDINVNVIIEGRHMSNKTILQIAFQEWNVHAIKLLLAHKDINTNLILSEDYNPNKLPDHLKDVKTKGNDETFLHCAAEKQDIEIMQLLLKKKEIDINYLTSKVIINRNISKNPIGESDTIIKEKKTALIIAVEQNNSEMVRLLLDYPKIDINVKSNVTTIERKYGSKLGENGGGWALENETQHSENETALSIAERKGNKVIINLLKSK